MTTGYVNWAMARGLRRPPQRARSVMLPFNTDPFAKGYLYSAYTLGILTAARLRDFPYENYIQIFFPHAKAAGDDTAKMEFYPPLAIRQYVELGYLTAERWDWKELFDGDRRGLAAKLIEGLSRGRYLHVFLDEFMIPGTAPYLRANSRHEHLLIGYDGAASVVVGAAYLASGSFGLTRTPLALLVEAMLSPGGRVAGRYHDSNEVLEIAPSGLADPGGQVTDLRTRLRAYLAGDADTVAHLRRLRRLSLLEGPKDLAEWGFAGYRGAFGVGVYPLLKEWIERSVREGRKIDLRATRILLEHKGALRQCLRPLVEDRELKAGLLAEFDRIVTAARAVHVMAFEANRKPPSNPAQLADSLVRRIEEIEREEREIISGLLE